MIPYKIKEFLNISYQLRKVKWMYQRIKYGFSDRDLWSFDYYLSKVISRGLRQLAVQAHGCPPEFYDKKKKGDECIKWRQLLLTIAEGFEADIKLSDDEVLDYSEADKLFTPENIKWGEDTPWSKKLREIKNNPQSKKLIKAYEKKRDKGFDLFKKHYNSFWD